VELTRGRDGNEHGKTEGGYEDTKWIDTIKGKV
jgi:hypothetical protein